MTPPADVNVAGETAGGRLATRERLLAAIGLYGAQVATSGELAPSNELLAAIDAAAPEPQTPAPASRSGDGGGEAKPVLWWRRRDGVDTVIDHPPVPANGNGWQPLYTKAPPPDALAMARRFLGWKLPKDFCPDAGISFTPYPDALLWPIGTNLFNEDQAKAMFEHCSAGLSHAPEAKAEPATSAAMVEVKPVGMVAKATFGAHRILVPFGPLEHLPLGTKVYVEPTAGTSS